MLSNVEQRLFRLEHDSKVDDQQIASILARLAALEQRQYAAAAGAGGGGGTSGRYLGCTLSAALAHGGNLTGQTVWRIDALARDDVDTDATVYHDGPSASSDLASGTQVILDANDDGTYTVAGKYCP